MAAQPGHGCHDQQPFAADGQHFVCAIRRVDRQPGYLNDMQIEAAATPVLDGDYNDDGEVDAADYVVWRKNPTRIRRRPGRLRTLADELRHGGWLAAADWEAVLPFPNLRRCCSQCVAIGLLFAQSTAIKIAELCGSRGVP